VRLQPLRERLVHRAGQAGGGAARLRAAHRRLHLRGPGRRRAHARPRAAAPGRRDLHAGRLPEPLRAVQDGPRPAGGARLGPFRGHVGRPRGRQRLLGRPRRERHPARGVPAASRRRLPGVLRDDALRASRCPRVPQLRLYRRLRFGNLVDLSVLDTRQYRSRQACGGGARSDCAEALDPARSILGAEQERWLFGNLADARARWTVLGQQVPTFARDQAAANPAGRFAMDKWDGFVAGAAAAVSKARGDPRAQPDRALRRRAHALGRRPEARLRRSAIADRRRRVHEHVDLRGRRRQRGQPDLGARPRRQPAREIPQRAARLRLPHRDPRRRCARTSGCWSV
jgi:hypothetical protein